VHRCIGGPRCGRQPDERALCSLILELNKVKYSGVLDYTKCVFILDSTIFKDSALYEKPEPEVIDQIKMLLKKLLTKKKSTALLLDRIFHEMDEDRSNGLSYHEIQKSFRRLGLSTKDISDDQLR